MTIENVQKEWERLGKRDPFWAALTKPGKETGWQDAEFVATGEREINEVLRYLRDNGIEYTAGRALDFGCGPGRLSIGLSHHFNEVVGVDVAPSMLEVAQKLTGERPGIRFVLNDRQRLSLFADGEFDFIYSNHVLQHIPPVHSLSYVAEFGRVLKPGGLAVFYMPVGRRKDFKSRVRGLVPGFLEPVINRLRFGDLPLMRMHGVPSRRVVAVASKSGLDSLDVVFRNDPEERWRNCLYVFRKNEA